MEYYKSRAWQKINNVTIPPVGSENFNIVLYSGVPGVDKSFRVATMSVKFDSHFKKIMGAFYDSCLC